MPTESKPAVHTATLLDRYLADSGLYARCMQFRAATTQAAIERAYDDIKAYKADSHAALVASLRETDALVKACAAVVLHEEVVNHLPYGLRDRMESYLRDSAAERALALAEEQK